MRKILFIILFLFSFFPAFRVFAADVFLSASGHLNAGETFALDINVDTGGELINSADIVLDYPEDIVSFAGYKKEDGVIGLWLDAPHAKDGKILLSGIIPGGVAGLYDPNQNGPGGVPLARLLFVAEKEGTARFSFERSSILKHDGKGSILIHEQKNADFIIGKNQNAEEVKSMVDTNPPLPFSISFVQSSFFSSTPSMIIFDTSDADSGVKYYKIKIGSGGWKDAKNPQPISQGFFPYSAILRAFDFSDNFTEASIKIPGLIPFQFLLVTLALILCGIFARKMLK